MSGWALVNPIGAHGVEVVTDNGAHFCVPRDVWEEWMREAWASVLTPAPVTPEREGG